MEHAYLILVRHGTRQREWCTPEEQQRLAGWPYHWGRPTADAVATLAAGSCPPDFNAKGFPKICAMSGRLADELALRGVKVSVIRSSDHLVARETAQVLEGVMQVRGRLADDFPCEVSDAKGLTPPEEWMELPALENRVRDVTTSIGDWKRRPSRSGRAYVAVGHEPQLTFVARQFAPLGADGLSIDTGEIACVDLDTKRLEWVLTAMSDEMRTQLLAKVESKFEAAKFVLGALVIEGGFVLDNDLWNRDADTAKWLVFVGAGLACLGLGLAVATLFAYDELRMPARFWSNAPRNTWARRILQSSRDRLGLRGAPRPPSQDQMVLYREMQYIWYGLFFPALCVALASLGSFAASLAYDHAPHNLRRDAILAVAAIVAMVSFWMFKLFRPDIGVSD